MGENVGSEENKIRPVVVLQADAYNFKSPVFTCAIISSSTLTIPDIQVPIYDKSGDLSAGSHFGGSFFNS